MIWSRKVYICIINAISLIALWIVILFLWSFCMNKETWKSHSQNCHMSWKCFNNFLNSLFCTILMGILKSFESKKKSEDDFIKVFSMLNPMKVLRDSFFIDDFLRKSSNTINSVLASWFILVFVSIKFFFFFFVCNFNGNLF